MNKHSCIAIYQVNDAIDALQNTSDMLEPLGILRTGQDLIGSVQAIAHGMNVLDVKEGYLTGRVVLLVFVPATRGTISKCIDIWPRVHYMQALIRVIEVRNVLQVHFVPEAALACDSNEWL